MALGPDTRLFLEAGEASLLIEDRRVTASGAEAREKAAGAKRLDCSGCELAPADVNGHTHLYSALVPLGMPKPEPAPTNFLEILERVWWRLDRALDERSLKAAARLYIAEALLFGTGSLLDHHESPNFIDGSLDVLGEAAEELGIRLFTCYGATERNRGRDEAKAGLAECARFAKRQTRRVRAMVGIHASFTVSDETIEAAGGLAQELGVPMHVHVAEDAFDVKDAKRHRYPGPFERLEGALPPQSVLAHCVHMDLTQCTRVLALDHWIVQNPRSNMANGVGWPGGLRYNPRVALGTDGFPSDMQLETMALGEHAHAARDTEFNSQMFGYRRQAGWLLLWQQLQPGKKLDPEVWRSPEIEGIKRVPDIVVREQGRLRHLIVDGELMVEAGRLVRGDLEAIRAEAQEQAARLWRRMAAL